jgi:Trypsin
MDKLINLEIPAHCVITDNPGSFQFVAGEHKLSAKEGTEQRVKAVKVVAHEKYK